MTNRGKPIKQKIGLERNKEVWLLKNPEGKVIEKFRQRSVAVKVKRKKELDSFGEEYSIERDNSYLEKLKEVLYEQKRKV